MKLEIKVWAVVLTMLFGQTVALAATKTIECEPPKGKRVHYVFEGSDHGPSWFDDSYTGVRPLFIYDDEKPKEITFFWGHTRPVGVPLEAVPATEKSTAVVVQANSMMLAAVSVGIGYLETYAFFFLEGTDLAFGTFGGHRARLMDAVGDTFAAMCKVSIE